MCVYGIYYKINNGHEQMHKLLIFNLFVNKNIFFF